MVNDSGLGVRNLSLDYLDTAGDLDVLGFAVDVNLQSTETLLYQGGAGNNDNLQVLGTSGDDQITVAPLDSDQALVFVGGDPWDGPDEGDLFDQFPGLAGGGQAPDIRLGGAAGLQISGGGNGAAGDQLYIYAPSEADLIDAGTAPTDPFGFGTPGMIIPGAGAGNAFNNITVDDAQVSVDALLAVGIDTPSFVQVADQTRRGLIVNAGFEDAANLPVNAGLDIADFISGTISSNFAIEVNGGDPVPATAPDGDVLEIQTPGDVNVYSDKQTPPQVTITSTDPVTGTPTLEFGFSSIESTILTPGPASQTVNLIGDNNGVAAQTDNFVVLGIDVDANLAPIAGAQPEFQPDADGDNEFVLQINGSAPIGFRNVAFLNVTGGDEIDTLELTPYADDTPTGWGIDVTYDEGAPGGDRWRPGRPPDLPHRFPGRPGFGEYPAAALGSRSRPTVLHKCCGWLGDRRDRFRQ